MSVILLAVQALWNITDASAVTVKLVDQYYVSVSTLSDVNHFSAATLLTLPFMYGAWKQNTLIFSCTKTNQSEELIYRSLQMAYSKKPLAAALGAAFLASAVSPVVSADTNPFAANQLSGGYDLVNFDSHEGKCGEGKCGEGKGDAEGKCGEGKCGGEKSAEGKCGEGKCGGEKSAEGKCGEGKCGGEKSAEGKCGEGKCGGH